VISCTDCHRRKQKCDRGLPCANCISRGKEGSCQYETGKPVAKAHAGPPAERPSTRRLPESATHTERAVDLGYTQHHGVSTLDVLRRIESASDGERLASLAAEQGANSSAGVRERYKALIRQLPARTYVEDLAGFYFHDINWQYFGVDEIIFRELMARWYNVPYAVFANVGPQGLESMLREFPALMFQISACTLLYLRQDMVEKFEALKYADMSFDDLAMDYSESGAAILSLLGKRQMTMIAPLAGWVRAKFLKNCGMVTESWHQLGTAIRDAQEIGMHRDEKDPYPEPRDSIEQSLEKFWMAQQRRRIWITLLSWDIHMGSVLGRTPQCDIATVSETLPVDVMPSMEGRRMPMIPRPDDSPPTPLTRAIWLFKMVRPLRDIIGLEKQGPFPKDFSHIERIQQSLQDMEAQMPAPFRLYNPDTRFDHLPECWWLSLTRPTIPMVLHFGKLALHRPYIFTRASSRLEALKASFGMLDAQQQYFSILNPSHHRMFSLFYGTFDAVVMVASIFILFPREHTDLFDEALQHFEWANERFEKMAVSNELAKSAISVLNTLHMRLKRIGHAEKQVRASVESRIFTASIEINKQKTRNSIEHSGSLPHIPAAASVLTPATIVSSTSISSAPNGLSAGTTESSTTLTPDSSADNLRTNVDEPGVNGNRNTFGNAIDIFSGGVDWSLPPDFDLSSIIPMYPIADLTMNDLTGFFGAADVPGGSGDGSTTTNWIASTSSPAADTDMPTTEHQKTLSHGTHLQGNSNGHLSPEVAAAAAAAATSTIAGSYETGISGHPAQARYQSQGAGNADTLWQFGGDFGNDTVWNLFNQIPWSASAATGP